MNWNPYEFANRRPAGAAPVPNIPPWAIAPIQVVQTGQSVPPTQVRVPLSDGSQIEHTASVPNALAALADARRIAGTFSALDSASYEEQYRGTLALFEAIGAFYRNANVIPQSDPLYVKWFREWFANGTVDGLNAIAPVNPRDPAWARVNGVGQTVTMGLNAWRGGIGGRLTAMWNGLGKDPIDRDHVICSMVIRMQLDDQGRVLGQCKTIEEAEPCNLIMGPGTYVGCANEGSPREGCSSYKWSTLVWNDPPLLPGRASEIDCRVTRAIPPLRWFFQAAADLVEKISARSDELSHEVATATWLAACHFAALWNIKLARDLNVLPSDLTAFAANLPENAELVEMDAHTRAVESTRGMQMIAQATGNPYAQAFVALVQIFAATAPMATAYTTDPFGRPMPFPLKVDMSGQTASVFRPGLVPLNIQIAHPDTRTPHKFGPIMVVAGVGVVGFLGWLFFRQR